MIPCCVLQNRDAAFLGIYAEEVKPYFLCKADLLRIIANVNPYPSILFTEKISNFWSLTTYLSS